MRRAWNLSAALALVVAGCVSLPAPLDCIDEDLDGYLRCGAPHVDCDDRAAATHPGALERCGDGIDDDCDGADLACTAAATPNTTSSAGELWTVRNGAAAIAFDRGAASDGRAGVVGLRGGQPDAPELLTTSTLASDRFAAVTRWFTAFSWRSGAAAPTSSVLAEGPALVQVALGWRDADLLGTSAYTIYPDGRIHRHDEVQVGADGQGSYLSSYASLDALEVDVVDWAAHDAPIAIPSAGGHLYRAGVDGPADFVCARAGGVAIGLTARGPAGAPGLRITDLQRVAGPPEVRTLGLSFDWVHEQPVPSGSYAVDLLFHVGATTGPPCQAIAPFAAAYLAPPRPTVAGNGGLVPFHPGDADGDGYVERAGLYVVTTGGDPRLALTMTGAMPSLALRLEEVEDAFDPVVSVDGARLVHGRDYFVQRDGAQLWAVVLVPLAAAQTVTFEWP